MVQIFLAHANEDKEAVTGLYNRLKERGFQPWMDKEDLVPGQNWRSEIPKAIKNSDVFLACLSQVSVSKKGYVQKEFRIALNNYAEMPPGSAYLIPVRLNDCEIPELRQDEYGVNLSDIHWVNLFESGGFEKLVRAIDYHFPGSPNETSSDSAVIREPPPTVLQTPVSKEPPKETQKGEKQVVIIQEGPKYDFRGAQFAGGFAETVLGNQSGGTINNEPSEPSTLESSRPTIETKAIDLGSGITLELVRIPRGRFLMGAPKSESYSRDRERPQHKVTVPEFWMGKYPVTQAQYQTVKGENPSDFLKGNHPVEKVSWHEAIDFCEKLSQKAGAAFKLPNEAEWEYACRAGTSTSFYFGDSITAIQANSGTENTSTVGSFPPNSFGLYDMHGNVWEWCQDHWHPNYTGAPNDGSAWVTDNQKTNRVLRGGSWSINSEYCRSAYRINFSPSFCNNAVGFRVVCSAPRILL